MSEMYKEHEDLIRDVVDMVENRTYLDSHYGSVNCDNTIFNDDNKYDEVENAQIRLDELDSYLDAIAVIVNAYKKK